MVTWSTLVEGDEQQDWPSQQATQVDEDKRFFVSSWSVCDLQWIWPSLLLISFYLSTPGHRATRKVCLDPKFRDI